jgi:multiple sugar transport system ATP-binding protein
MVFQNYALYPHMTVREHGLRPEAPPDAEGAEIERASPRRRDSRLEPCSSAIRASSRAASASASRWAARSCAIPQVFLFDEPLSNLDAKLRVQMRAEIKELHQRLGRPRSTSRTTRSRR